MYTKVIAGDTIKFTAISSGDTFTSTRMNILTGSETVIASATLSSSGDGHYYYNYTIPYSGPPGFYVGEMLMYVNSLSYIKKHRFKVTVGEVD